MLQNIYCRNPGAALGQGWGRDIDSRRIVAPAGGMTMRLGYTIVNEGGADYSWPFDTISRKASSDMGFSSRVICPLI